MAITNEQRDALKKRAQSWVGSGSTGVLPSRVEEAVNRFMTRFDKAEGTTIKEKVLNGLFEDTPYGDRHTWCSTVTQFARAVLNDSMTMDQIDHYWIQQALQLHPEMDHMRCAQCAMLITRAETETDVEKLREIIRDLRAKLAESDHQVRTDQETLRAVYNYIGGREPLGEARNRHVEMLPRQPWNERM